MRSESLANEAKRSDRSGDPAVSESDVEYAYYHASDLSLFARKVLRGHTKNNIGGIEKKNRKEENEMSKELEKNYSPSDIEGRLYKKWMDNGYFHAEVDETKKPFTIVIQCIVHALRCHPP